MLISCQHLLKDLPSICVLSTLNICCDKKYALVVILRLRSYVNNARMGQIHIFGDDELCRRVFLYQMMRSITYPASDKTHSKFHQKIEVTE